MRVIKNLVFPFGLGIFISMLFILLFSFWQEEKEKTTQRQPIFIESKNDFLENFREEETKYIPVLYQTYIDITEEYKNYFNNKQNTDQLETNLNRISNVFDNQFNKIEASRLSYRSKLSKEEKRSKEFNDLYHFSYLPRWRLKMFLDFYKEKENQHERNLKSIYKDEIMNGFEKEFPILLDYLKIGREEYPNISSFRNREQNITEGVSNKLKIDITLQLMSQSLEVKEIQIVGNDNYSTFVSLKLKVENGDEQFLIRKSKKIYRELLTSFPGITYLSINLETDRGDFLMTGLGSEVFAKSSDLKKVADLYKYIKK